MSLKASDAFGVAEASIDQAWRQEFPILNTRNPTNLKKTRGGWIKHDIYALALVVQLCLSHMALRSDDPHFEELKYTLNQTAEDMKHVRKYTKTTDGVSREFARNPIMTLEDAMTRWDQIERTLKNLDWNRHVPLQGQVQEFSS